MFLHPLTPTCPTAFAVCVHFRHCCERQGVAVQRRPGVQRLLSGQFAEPGLGGLLVLRVSRVAAGALHSMQTCPCLSQARAHRCTSHCCERQGVALQCPLGVQRLLPGEADRQVLTQSKPCAQRLTPSQGQGLPQSVPPQLLVLEGDWW